MTSNIRKHPWLYGILIGTTIALVVGIYAFWKLASEDTYEDIYKHVGVDTYVAVFCAEIPDEDAVDLIISDYLGFKFSRTITLRPAADFGKNVLCGIHTPVFENPRIAQYLELELVGFVAHNTDLFLCTRPSVPDTSYYGIENTCEKKLPNNYDRYHVALYGRIGDPNIPVHMIHRKSFMNSMRASIAEHMQLEEK